MQCKSLIFIRNLFCSFFWILLCNISNYSIFFKDNWLFAYFEYTGNDFEADMRKMAQDEVTIKWWNVVKPLMDPLETRQPGEFWADMEEIFHLD